MDRKPGLVPNRPRASLNNANWHSIRSGAKLGRFALKARSKKATEQNETVSDKLFVATVRKLLATPPKVHDEMKLGARPKPSAQQRGSKGRKGSGK